jgi:hypothetical protein
MPKPDPMSSTTLLLPNVVSSFHVLSIKVTPCWVMVP